MKSILGSRLAAATVACVTTAVLVGGVTYAVAATPSPPNTYYACARNGLVDQTTIKVNVAPACGRNWTVVSWGATGPTGPVGAKGATGAAGAKGATGSAGAAGAAGATGAAGSAGPAGPTGASGTNGSSGAVGPQGATGAPGAAGTNGIDGVAGPTGSPGAPGMNGTNGTDGFAGPTGPTGAPGANGAPGAPGATGAVGPMPRGFGSNTGNAGPGRSADCTIGEMLLTAGRIAQGLPARGELLSINQYQELFSLIGTTYGGDGQTTFAVPDLRSVTPDNMTYSICDEGYYPSSD